MSINNINVIPRHIFLMGAQILSPNVSRIGLVKRL